VTVSGDDMKGLLCLLTCALLGVGAINVVAADVQPVPIEVQATLSGSMSKSGIVEFKLKNTGYQPISLYASDLPWGVRTSIMLVPVLLGADQAPLEPALYIDDPGPAVVIIAPAATLHGSVELVSRFPRLPAVLKERGVMLFWSYRVNLIDGRATVRQSGAVELPALRSKVTQ
jgi:hypothetical protein